MWPSNLIIRGNCVEEVAYMPELPDSTAGDTSWFVHDRFGLFIHWGLYSAAASKEWIKHRECMSDERYQRYFDHFNPDLLDPAAWAREAKNAGMKYFVITTKHHEGFCLWDSALTEYKAPNTPAGRDLLAPIVEAFRAEGLKVGFYHSLLDWNHPEYPIDEYHPLRLDMEKRNQSRDIAKYREYLHAQTRELLTNFGKIDIIWFDFSYSKLDWGWSRGRGKDDWHSEELMAMVRELQPGIIVNDRLEIGGDVRTPEQTMPRSWMKVDGKPVVWEACHTLNGSWGYDRDNLDWKSSKMLIGMLIDAVSKGGNLLLNVGPNARGRFEPKAIERLRGIGEWMDLHSRSIYGCTASDFEPPKFGLYTQNGKQLYLHLFEWPYGEIVLPELAGKVDYMQLLNDASEIGFWNTENPTNSEEERSLSISLPVQQPDVAVPVIEIFLK